MKAGILIIILVLVSGLFFYGVSSFAPELDVGEFRLQSEIFSVDNGFGYTITYKGKTLIRQKSIPAMEELKSFCSKDDAYKVAGLVIKKLEGNDPPTISREDLIKLKIRTNCLRLAK